MASIAGVKGTQTSTLSRRREGELGLGRSSVEMWRFAMLPAGGVVGVADGGLSVSEGGDCG
jgi:hypothetical protein